MNIQIARSEMLQLLSSIVGVVERRQSLPILSNVLLQVEDDELRVSATDLELQIERRTQVQNLAPGRITAPARKLHDICRGLPEGATIELRAADGRLLVRSGRSRFSLATLDAAEYPTLDAPRDEHRVEIPGSVLKRLIQKTQFAMALQDVRYYLNGLLLEFKPRRVRAVATDGHRLALAEAELPDSRVDAQVILPRKAVLEMQRLLDDREEPVVLHLGTGQVTLEMPPLRVVSKLIDGRFPDYERVIPTASDRLLSAERDAVRAALSRAAILSNEKFRGVRLSLDGNLLRIQSQNPEQEEAEEELEVEYRGDPMEIGFNVNYLLDALGALDSERFEMHLRGADASGLIHAPADESCRFVVMPMRL